MARGVVGRNTDAITPATLAATSSPWQVVRAACPQASRNTCFRRRRAVTDACGSESAGPLTSLAGSNHSYASLMTPTPATRQPAVVVVVAAAAVVELVCLPDTNGRHHL